MSNTNQSIKMIKYTNSTSVVDLFGNYQEIEGESEYPHWQGMETIYIDYLGNVMIYVNVSLKSSGFNYSSTFAWGVSSIIYLPGSDFPTTITPKSGGWIKFLDSNGSKINSLTGYGGAWNTFTMIVAGETWGGWQPARIYTEKKDIGGWAVDTVVNSGCRGIQGIMYGSL